jgi:hypothetical protein
VFQNNGKEIIVPKHQNIGFAAPVCLLTAWRSRLLLSQYHTAGWCSSNVNRLTNRQVESHGKQLRNLEADLDLK